MALILPKKHFDNIYEMDDETASKVFVLAKKMATAMTKAFDCDGFNVIQNNGGMCRSVSISFSYASYSKI